MSVAGRSGVEPSRWVLVVPFKGAPLGKSRLGRDFDARERAALAEAFLADTIAALRRTPSVLRVLVVSGSPLPARVALSVELAEGEVPVTRVPDAGGGLNAAVAAGLSVAREEDPTAWTAVVPGDLPLLAPSDLAVALTAAAGHRYAVVADKDGTGTTFLSAAPGAELEPRFGPDSFAAHRSLGHVPLPLQASSTLRFDVDDPSDLQRVALLADPASETRSVLALLGRPPGGDGRPSASRAGVRGA